MNEERIREEIENTINKYACGASSDDEDSINQWYEDYITEILSLITTEIEKVRENNPYPAKPKLASAEYYAANGYDRACQRILNLLKEQK